MQKRIAYLRMPELYRYDTGVRGFCISMRLQIVLNVYCRENIQILGWFEASGRTDTPAGLCFRAASDESKACRVCGRIGLCHDLGGQLEQLQYQPAQLW